VVGILANNGTLARSGEEFGGEEKRKRKKEKKIIEVRMTGRPRGVQPGRADSQSVSGTTQI
jgi:hypothetical protein